MKKCSIRISVLSIAFSVMFLVISTGTKAEMQDGPKKDLVSELRLESPSPLGPKSYSVGNRLFQPARRACSSPLEEKR